MNRTAPFLFFHVSNLFTYLSILSALVAFSQAQSHDYHGCGLGLALSVIFDVLDGKFASLFRRDENLKEFGKEIDSLADGIVFGLFPFLCAWQLADPHEQGVIIPFFSVGFFYVLSALTRLGVFNIIDDHKNFTGLPTTLAGLAFSWLLFFLPGPMLSMAFFGIFGVLMVLPFQFARPKKTGLIVLSALVLLTVFAHGLLRYA